MQDDQDDQDDEIAATALHVGGWSVGDTAFHDVDRGGIIHVVIGSNGENQSGPRARRVARRGDGRLTRPAGIFQSTPPPEPAKVVPIDPPPPGVEQVDDAVGSTSKAAKPRKKKPAAAVAVHPSLYPVSGFCN